MACKDVYRQLELSGEDKAFLDTVRSSLSILADICRADLILYCRSGEFRVIPIEQAGAHLGAPLHEPVQLGQNTSLPATSEILTTLNGHADPREVHTANVRGATVARQVFPVYSPTTNKIVAALVQDAYWLAHERHKRRSRVFQEALSVLTNMALRGELRGAEELSVFDEHDGVMLVGADGRIQYMSGILTEQFRRLGYRDPMIGRDVGDLDTVDREMIRRALNENRCQEGRTKQNGLTWVRKVLPIRARRRSLRGALTGRIAEQLHAGRTYEYGAFVLVHDETEALRNREELESRTALVRDMHHRVKNNLMVIASIMGMQARRVKSAEAKAVLEESVQRVMSVAVVHEFLSHNVHGTINLKEVAQRILSQTQQGLIAPGKDIRLDLNGPDVWLPAERATQCALVVNELVQNAIEHGLPERDAGHVHVELMDDGGAITLVISDDGEGFPDDFDLERDANLGLRLVRSMVERDLKGRFEIEQGEKTKAVVRFDKSTAGGA